MTRYMSSGVFNTTLYKCTATLLKNVLHVNDICTLHVAKQKVQI